MEKLESPVYEAPGDARALTRQAGICIAQTLKAGVTTAPVILNTDLEGGVIVARNVFDYSEFVLFSPLVSPARTTVTFEARPGRFRITHSDIRVFNQEWRPIRSTKPGKRDEMSEQLSAISEQIASCVKRAAQQKDW